MRSRQADRVPVKLPGLPPDAPVDLSLRHRFDRASARVQDRMASWGVEGATGFFYTEHPDVQYHEYTRPSGHAGYEEHVQELTVPAGRLEGVEWRSPVGLPSYQKQYMVREPADAEILLSIPYVPARPDPTPYFDKVRETGDDGVVLVGMVDVVYNVHRLVGSEPLALWSVDHRDLVHAMLEFFCRRQVDVVTYCLSLGMGPSFGWVGPEVCVPPLMGPRDFDEFVVPYDRRLTDAIHESDGIVWVHSHGHMDDVLEGFVEAGVDCLQPLEPPPYGDLVLADAKRRVGGRLCLEGNLECHDFDTLCADAMRDRVRQIMRDAAPGGGFILACASGPTSPLTPRSAENVVVAAEAARDYGRYPVA